MFKGMNRVTHLRFGEVSVRTPLNEMLPSSMQALSVFLLTVYSNELLCKFLWQKLWHLFYKKKKRSCLSSHFQNQLPPRVWGIFNVELKARHWFSILSQLSSKGEMIISCKVPQNFMLITKRPTGHNCAESTDSHLRCADRHSELVPPQPPGPRDFVTRASNQTLHRAPALAVSTVSTAPSH